MKTTLLSNILLNIKYHQKRMEFSRVISLIFFCFLFVPVCKSGPITVYGGIIPGLHSYKKNGEVEGNIFLAFDRLMKVSNIEYDLQLMNLARANRQFRKEQESFYISMARVKSNEKNFQWILPWSMLDFRIAKLKSSKVEVPKTFKALKKYNFGVQRGAVTEGILKQQGFIEGKHYITMPDPVQLVKLLNDGLIDFVFYEPTISANVLSLYGYSPEMMEITDIEVPNKPEIWLAGSKRLSVDIVNKIKQNHERLLAEHEYSSLIQGILPSIQ